MVDRVRFVLEQRGYDTRNVRAVTHGDPAARQPAGREAQAGNAARVHGVRRLQAAGRLFKRVRNIAKNLDGGARRTWVAS